MKLLIMTFLMALSVNAMAQAQKMTCGIFKGAAIGKPVKVLNIDLQKKGLYNTSKINDELFFTIAHDYAGNISSHLTNYLVDIDDSGDEMSFNTTSEKDRESVARISASLVKKMSSGDSIALEQIDYVLEENYGVICFALQYDEYAPFEDAPKTDTAIADIEINDKSRSQEVKGPSNNDIGPVNTNYASVK